MNLNIYNSMIKKTFVIILFLNMGSLIAEPWLSNRFSQNCAGCHAPGRKNKKPKDRRCALSCQGCHVNPNGGGLRSFYGKWNENHWLRSFKVDFLKQKPSFVKTEKQNYDRVAQHLFANPENLAQEEAPTKEQQDPQQKVKNKKTKKTAISQKKLERLKKIYTPKMILKKGVPLKLSRTFPMNESDFTRADRREHITSQDDTEFMLQVPQKDPIRQLLATKIDAGGDFRLLYNSTLNQKINNVSGKPDPKFFLMSADIGLRYRPIYKNLHFVLEHRTFGRPNNGQNLEQLTSNNASHLRSAYAMVDDLPYNTFVMAGVYKPLFGYATADHTSLAQSILATGLGGNVAYNQRFEGVTVGLAPNVPYANFHYLRKNLASTSGEWTGYGLNAGLKFVTLGGNINYSFFKAKHELEGGDTDILAQSVVIGGMLQPNFGTKRSYPIIANLEYMLINRKSPTQEQNNGTITFDSYLKFWREFYANLQYATSNSAKDFANGEASQLKVGVRSFITSGVDLSLHYIFDTERKDPVGDESFSETTENSLQAQLHVYF